MSITAINWTIDQSLPSTLKLVMMTLANRANIDNNTCFPSLNRITSDSGLSKSTVIRTLKELCKRGLIKKEYRNRNDGGYTSNLYTLVIAQKTNSKPISDTLQTNQPDTKPISKKPSKTPFFEHLMTLGGSSIVTPPLSHHDTLNKIETKSPLKTTTEGSQEDINYQTVGAEIVVALSSFLSIQEKQKAASKLARVNKQQRELAISAFNTKATEVQAGKSGFYKTAMAYLNSLINQAMNNELIPNGQSYSTVKQETAIQEKTDTNPDKPKLTAQQLREHQLRHFINKHKSPLDLIASVKNSGAFYAGSFGLVMKKELEELGLWQQLTSHEL